MYVRRQRLNPKGNVKISLFVYVLYKTQNLVTSRYFARDGKEMRKIYTARAALIPFTLSPLAAVTSRLLTIVKTALTIVSYFGNVTASLFTLTIVRKFTPR